MLWISGYSVSSRSFDPVIGAYRNAFDCVTFDNRGTGKSSQPWLPFSIVDLAVDAVRVLDAHEIESALVYGVSMGGMIAQELALRFPDRVRGVILGGTTAGGSHAARAATSDVLRLLGTVLANVSPAKRGSRHDRRHLEAFSEAFLGNDSATLSSLFGTATTKQPTLSTLALQAWASGLHNADHRLRRLPHPTLVLHGEADRLVPVSNALALHERIPGSELAVLPGAAHAYWLEQPERCFDLISSWAARSLMPSGAPPLEGIDAANEGLTRAISLQLALARGSLTACSLASRGVLNRVQSFKPKDAVASDRGSA
jgi:3-oxoadipate enol-lactonase